MVRICNGIDLGTGRIVLCNGLEEVQRVIQVVQYLGINFFDRLSWKNLLERGHVRKDGNTDV